MATRPIEAPTRRLMLRQWCDEDRTPFASLNADPLVMEHLPALLTRDQSGALVDRCSERIKRDGYGLWAVEIRGSSEFIGYVGLAGPRGRQRSPPAPRSDGAWPGQPADTVMPQRPQAQHWQPLSAQSGSTTRFRSRLRDTYGPQHLMQRIGMTNSPSEDFDHPLLAGGPLRRHVLYRISRADWERRDQDPPCLRRA